MPVDTQLSEARTGPESLTGKLALPAVHFEDVTASLIAEFSNTIGSILVASQLGQDSHRILDFSTAKEILAQIEMHAASCRHTLRSARQFSQNQACEKSPMDVRTIVTRTYHVLREFAHAQGKDLHLSLDENTLPVLANAYSLEQALSAALRTVIEATRLALPISLRAMEVLDVAARPLVQIRIEPYLLPLRNEYRGCTPSTPDWADGCAQKLTLLRRIVNEHDGLVQLYSGPSEPLRINIDLPRSNA